jgi:hypothetical protein
VTRALALAIVVLVAAAPAASAQTLRVEGFVENGTTGEPAPRGARLEVAVVGSDGQRIDVAATRVDRRGRFTATVEAGAGARTVVSTRYEGITYSTIARPGAEVASAELVVFETTRDPDVLSVEADTTVLEVSGEELEALQIVRVTNASDRTFVGESGQTSSFRLPLPDGAFAVSIVDGLTPGRSRPEGSALEAGDPLQPGDATFSYAYKVRSDDGSWGLDRESFYPTARMDVLVEPDLELAGGDFRLLGDLDFGGDVYRQYVKNDIEAGARTSFTVAASGGAGVLPILAGAAALIALAVAAWRIGRSRSARPPEQEPGDRGAILESIAALDLAHDAGSVGESDYRARREELKSRLR